MTHTASLFAFSLLLLSAGHAVAQASGGEASLQERKKACIVQHEESQQLRRSSRLKAAREALLICAQDICPTVVRSDCLPWLEQVAKSIPSVVVRAKLNGADTFDVKVSVDGQAVSSRLDGKPIELDPGLHNFRFERSETDVIVQDVLLEEGQANRVVLVEFGAPKPNGESTAPAYPRGESAPVAPMEVKKGPIPKLAYVLGGVAVVGGGAFAGFGLWAMNERKTLQSSCQPVCSQQDVDKVRMKLILADSSLGLGVLAAAGAVYLYLTRPNEVQTGPNSAIARQHDPKRPEVAFTPGPGGGMLSVRGVF